MLSETIPMHTKSKIMSAVFSLLAFIGCDGNYRNVNINGISESEIVEQTVTTDAEGYFQSTFEKAEAVDIIVTAPNYADKEQSHTIRRNKLNLDIFLEEK